MNERRRFQRYKVSLEVEYHVENDVDIQATARTFNISGGGISLPLNRAISPGKKIRLNIKVPTEDREIKAVGRVVWKRPVNLNASPEEDAGIKFLNMDRDSAETLTGYIQTISEAA